MSYIDGFVAAVPTANKEKYIKHASDAAAVFKAYGALKMVEYGGDDFAGELAIGDFELVGVVEIELEPVLDRVGRRGRLRIRIGQLPFFQSLGYLLAQAACGPAHVCFQDLTDVHT